MKPPFILILCIVLSSFCGFGQSLNLVADTEKPGVAIPSTLYGVFFEDINYGADGGLYAEKIKNRSFEFPQPLMGWETFGNVEVKSDGPFDRNPHYVSLYPASHKDKRTGLANEGFFGVSLEENEEYRFSVWARCADGGEGIITVQLIDPASKGESQVAAQTHIKITSTEWTKYNAILTPDQTVKRGKLRIFLRSRSPVDLEHISLFPVETWNNHENGLRADLVSLLKELQPGVFRFPGGCIVEGTDTASRYQWKNTIGPVENRPLNENRWHYTFENKFFPDYYQSNGLGFYEYFLLAEELGAEPLPVVNAGLICQFQNPDTGQPGLDRVEPYIQDVVDLIEFANGYPDSTWGRIRAEMGHPEPFNLKYIAVGNEQWGPLYPERLKLFAERLRRTNPEIKIIGSSGPYPEGEDFDYLSAEMKNIGVDLIDEHFYRSPEWFLSSAARYDNYDRNGPKIFAGEYACHGDNKKWNHFNAALMEAAFLTGVERNADIVQMATYAPLFAHEEGWQWRPDLIWFDNLNASPSSSYFVQKLFSANKGTATIPLTLNGEPLAGKEGQEGLYGSAAVDEKSGRYIIKLVNTGDKDLPLVVSLQGKQISQPSEWELITLSSPDLDSDNSLENPGLILPMVETCILDSDELSITLSAKTLKILKGLKN